MIPASRWSVLTSLHRCYRPTMSCSAYSFGTYRTFVHRVTGGTQVRETGSLKRAPVAIGPAAWTVAARRGSDSPKGRWRDVRASRRHGVWHDPKTAQEIVDVNEQARLDGLRSALALVTFIAMAALLFSKRLPTKQPGVVVAAAGSG